MKNSIMHNHAAESSPAIRENTAQNSSDPISKVPSDYGMMSLEDVRMLYERMEKEQILSRYTFPQKPLGDGRWAIYVKDRTAKDGRRKIRAKTLDELKEAVYQYEKGIDVHSRKTFKECFEIVLQERLRYVKDPEKLLSVMNTLDRDRGEYKRYFGGTEFERTHIDNITENDIDDLCVATLTRLELRRKAFLSMRSILKQVFELANRQHWIDDNPYFRLDFKRYKDMLAKSVPVSERLHTDEEIERMLERIHDHQKKHPDYVVSYALELQILTAMRRGELPPLTWNDINDEDGFISIHREQITMRGKKSEHGNGRRFRIVSHTKTYKDRRFPITSDVRECLDRIHLVHDLYYPDSPFLFPAKTEEGCISNSVVYCFYRRICRRLNIETDPNVIKGTHSFRRNAITRVMNSPGGGATMASKLFGNTPTVAEANYYTGLDLNAARLILES